MSGSPIVAKRVFRRVPSTPRRRPSVTAVIPAYNYARYLRECANSVLGQRDVDVRLIIIDDCSTDETPNVASDLGRDSRVAVLRNEPNIGHIPSVNRGMRLVETEFVVKLDADDLLAPGALARATALLDVRPTVSFVYGRPRHFSGPTPRAIDLPALSWTVWSGRDWFARLCRMGVNAISQPEVVMRTACLRRALPIRAELPHTSDMHLWMQLAAIGDVARINGPAQAYYREHNASMQRTVNAGTFFDLRSRRDAFDYVFAGLAGELPGAWELHDVAHRTLAGNGLDRACRAYDRGRTSQEPVDEFVAFALETWPRARELPEWTALARRQSVGTARAARDPRFVIAAGIRRGLEETSRLRWRHTGEVGPQRWQQLVTR
jgi:glycosyltransferase involved in cell wall biosynthesis